ncbi:hypothetical protein SAMN02910264_02306 [Ruminococcaceae bacterium YAD3003]|nr:hypothetical protein SAMN02910264_02306 [Ruminococcaceae bacterium YAD3003]
MRIKYCKIVSLFLSVVIALNLIGCSVFDRAGEEIADDILADATASTVTSIYDPNGTTLYEDIRTEDVLYETTLLESKLQEQLLSELLLEPEILQEGVKLEAIRVEVIDSEEQLYDDLACDSYYTSQLDYTIIRERFAKGSSLVIAEVAIDTGSLVVNVACALFFQAKWLDAAIDAGQIVFTLGSTTLSAFIAYHVAKAKSLAAGSSYEVAEYDALDMASNAFYYASVIVDAVNTVISLAQIVNGVVKAAKELAPLIKSITKAIKSADNSISVVKTIKGTFKVTKDGQTIICQLAADSEDLYDPSTGKYICSLVKNSSDELEVITKTIPKQILNKNGDLLYRINENTHEIFRVTKNASGNFKETLIGIVDEGGFVYNTANKVISRLDFTSGKLYSSAFTGLNKAGLFADVFGEITDTAGNKVALKKVDGVLSLVDDKGTALAKIYEGDDGLKWLQTIDEGRTIGRISDSGVFEFAWKSELDFIRSQATKTVRDALVKFVQSGEHTDAEIHKLFPDITFEQIEYIRTFGRVPPEIEVHHCFNVANYPDKAGDIRNLEFLSSENHKIAHGGNYQNPTASRSANYVDLAELFGIST